MKRKEQIINEIKVEKPKKYVNYERLVIDFKKFESDNFYGNDYI